MVYNSYFVNISVRLACLLGSFVGVAYMLINTHRFFSILFLILVSILQIIGLFSFLNRTNRNLARFLLLLTEEDTSVLAWKDQVEKTFQGLHHSFKKVNEEIGRMRLDSEKGTVLLQNVIDHVQTGILAVDEAGKVEIVNAAALKIFGKEKLGHMEELNLLSEGTKAELMGFRYGGGNILQLDAEGGLTPVLVNLSVFKLGDKTLKLFSLQQIKNQLEANEIESWQKMTRVLAHEISNSVTPLSTLGAGIYRKLSQAERDHAGGMIVHANTANDLLKSAELIQKRSDALVEFMEHYKSFTRLPDPVPEAIRVSEFLENISLLFSNEMEKMKIEMDLQQSEPGLIVSADRNLLEQAYINLIRNSIEAVQYVDLRKISLKASYSNQKVKLEVGDNGPGIPEEIRPQVFIPFFTTKPGGTGIGMSIVKKIVVMSGGSISLVSKPGEGTRFIMEFLK